MKKAYARLFSFLVTAFVTLLVFPVAAQKNIAQLSHMPFAPGTICSNLTGFVDSMGREYALVGTTKGVSVVRIDTPSNPKEIFLIPGATGQRGGWREVRTYKGFAYITTEQTSGLVIADLTHLPDTVTYHTVRPGNMITSHTIFIDEHGIAYVNGTDIGQLFLALDSNLWNPPLIGKFTRNYVHDCFVRKDTMWAACINDGIIKVVDVTDKANADNPAKTLAAFATPNHFAHNCWLSDDSKYLFTTDEKPNSYLACYDVTNLNNITEVDRAQSVPGSNSVIHNAYFLNNYIITSYYTSGIAIFDVLRKNNMVEVGHFDTSPLTGGTYNGAWGVWPYLPSGNIIVSDMETGLWVLKPTYKRAAYLEGNVKDASCGTNQNNVTIEIVGDTVTDRTNYLGNYSMGTVDTGTFTVRFSKQGYISRDTTGINFRNGLLKKINLELTPVSTTRLLVQTSDSATSDSLPFTRVMVQDGQGNIEQEIATNNLGQYNICDFVQGSYDFYAGRWGRETVKVHYEDTVSVDTILLPTPKGYYDDFIMDYGWTVSTDASSGAWVRAIPVISDEDILTTPIADVPGDFGRACYVTGNGGGAAGNDDVDDGYSVLRSPFFNIKPLKDPHITYYRWFYNGGGNTPLNDSLIVTLTNGRDTVIIDSVAGGASHQWVYKDIRVRDYMVPDLNMRIEFRAQDYSPGHVVEAAVDFFRVYAGVDTVVIDTTVDTTIIDTPVVINPIKDKAASIKAFPNPSNSSFFIAYSDIHSTNAWLEICNPLGQVVFTKKLSGREGMIRIDESLSSGLYYLKLLDGERPAALLKLVRTD